MITKTIANMNIVGRILTFVWAALIFAGCEKDRDVVIESDFTHGVYIINEGSFQASNGSISYFDPSAGRITNGIFMAANQRPLGDVVQSMAVVGDTAGFIVVNGSGKVEFVRLKDFRATSAPVPVVYPRFFLPVTPDKGYLSAGSMEGRIYVFDLHTREITDSIMVGNGPETLVKLNNHVFVANSGGWIVDSTVSVVDINTDEVVSTILVGKVPQDLSLDRDNKLWVYCKGYAAYNPEPPYDLISETDAVLVRLDPVTGNTLWQGSVGKAGDYTAVPPKLAASKEGDYVYYLRPEGVFRISVENPAVSTEALITGSYYGLEVNPEDGTLYLFESGFTGSGTLVIYDTEGNPEAQGTVGIAPNGAVFNLE